MKLDIRYLRWVFLALYATIVLGLFATAYVTALPLPGWLWPLEGLRGHTFWTISVLLVTVVSQALFVFGAGTVNLCRPVRKRRLFVPVVIASLMMTVLIYACFCSLTELFRIGNKELTAWGWALIPLSWLGWGFGFFVTYRKEDRYGIARKLVLAVLGGSLVELLVSIPSHIIVSKRPGCLVGLLTGIGITGGLAVMLWAFGPGIVLLFLRDRHKRESRQEEVFRSQS